MGAERFDAIVIGAGQGGAPLARVLAEAGWRTALIERAHVGGTCVNEGCTPTKTMIASARVAYVTGRAAGYGVRIDRLAVDLATVRARTREIVRSFRGGAVRRVIAAGVWLIEGEARFNGPRTLVVRLSTGGERELVAERIVINTGERPSRPALPGLDAVNPLDSTSIMELSDVPRHLLVIGGGYIGLEFAQMFRRFGSAVTVVQRSPRLLGREDPDIAEAVAAILREDGIEVLLATTPERVGESPEGVVLTVRGSDGEERTLVGTHLLVAAGRRPNTDVLDLASAGIETDSRGYITVDERLETTAPGVWAIGDVKGPPAFTHISYDDFRVLRTNWLEGGKATTTGRLVPYTVFLDPQLGRIGITESEAVTGGRDVLVAQMPMAYVARALEMDESRGMIKVVIDAPTGQILGAAVLGIEGGEMASMLQIAMMGGLPYTALRDAVFAHPTLAESLNNLFASLRTPMYDPPKEMAATRAPIATAAPSAS